MQISRLLIQKYLEGTCSESEALYVKDCLANHPDMFDALMTEDSWDNFNASSTSVEASPRMFDFVKRHTEVKQQKLKWLAIAAAATLLLFSAVYWFFVQQPRIEKTQELVQLSIPASRIIKFNPTSVVTSVVLPDKSTVSLSAGSSIEYDSVFGSRRDVSLMGEASFIVAKDSSRPFSVHTKHINVTALGTIFSVSDKDSLITSVKLFEGKVVVRKVAANVAKTDVYLSPGEKLNFNKRDSSFNVSRPDSVKSSVANATLQPKLGKELLPAEVQFNNRLLADIFKKVQTLYNVKIVLHADVSDMRFTGVLKPRTESLEDFLSTIGILNDLNVEKYKNTFIITGK